MGVVVDSYTFSFVNFKHASLGNSICWTTHLGRFHCKHRFCSKFSFSTNPITIIEITRNWQDEILYFSAGWLDTVANVVNWTTRPEVERTSLSTEPCSGISAGQRRGWKMIHTSSSFFKNPTFATLLRISGEVRVCCQQWEMCLSWHWLAGTRENSGLLGTVCWWPRTRLRHMQSSMILRKYIPFNRVYFPRGGRGKEGIIIFNPLLSIRLHVLLVVNIS